MNKCANEILDRLVVIGICSFSIHLWRRSAHLKAEFDAAGNVKAINREVLFNFSYCDDKRDPQDMEYVVRDNDGPRRQRLRGEFIPARDFHAPEHKIRPVLQPMLQANQEQLPPRQSGKNERQHVNHDVDRTNPGTGFFPFCHPIILQKVIADEMRVYPVHFDIPEIELIIKSSRKM
jgi:hypothetical protein